MPDPVETGHSGTRSTLSPALRRLALRRGLQLRFVDTLQRTVTASDQSVRAVLTAMGDEVANERDVLTSLGAIEEVARLRLLQPVIVVDVSRPLRIQLCRTPLHRIDVNLATEEGSEVPCDPRFDGDVVDFGVTLPAGYYELAILENGREHRARILAAPRNVFRHAPLQRRWGVFSPLYAIRGDHDAGIGTYGDLHDLMALAGDAGAACVGTLPLYSTFLDTSFDPSPYAPVSRLFWNEAHITLPGFEGIPGRMVDWRELARRKLEASLPLADAAFESDETRAAIALHEKTHPLTALYAAFRARVDTERRGWREWTHDSHELQEWADSRLARWYRWAQWRCESEIARLADAPTGVYLDFPLGSSPDGFDVWLWRHLYVDGASIGAPPDLAYRQGQDWGFRPPDPETMRVDGWRHWRDLIRRAMQPASMLRLDHVMGLHRMWWVPAGMSADHGLYVHYAAAELYAVLAIESHRASCTIIGENLGTVPPAVTRSMKTHSVLGMWALERQLTHADHGDLAPIQPDQVASIGTHDMPPFAAFVEGSDIEEKGRLGVISASRLDEERARRPRLLQLMRSWLDGQGLEAPRVEDRDALLEAVLVALAASPAPWLIVNLEDLWLETTSQNIPTTTTERPNWRPRLALTIQQMRRDETVRHLLRRVDEARRSGAPSIAR